MNKKGKFFIISLVLLVVAVVYTLLVKFVDVGAIGPENTEVGFQTLNKAVYQTIGVNMVWYDLTTILGFIPILMAVFYAGLGLKDLIDKKSFVKVDKKIIVLGCFYVLVLLTYAFFEKAIINYRPTLMDGELEASYPSSHTVLALCICGSSMIMCYYYIHKEELRKKINYLTLALMFIILVGRIISGVHWASDIIGGVIISGFLLSVFYTGILVVSKPIKRNKKQL